MPAPRISALVPSYNHAAHVGAAVESVLRQEGLGEDLEVVIVDDGSTDDSPAILRELAARDPRVRLEERENQGISATFQRLLELAQGEFVGYCCSDDRWHPNHLAGALAALEGVDDATVCFGRARLIDGEGNEQPDTIFGPLRNPQQPLASLLRDGNSLCFVATVFRRQVALAAGGFDFELRVLQDYDLWLKLVASGRALYRDAPSVDFRWDGNNASGPAASLRKREDLIRVLTRALETVELLERDAGLRDSVVARVRRSHLRVARRVDDRAQRREHLRQARALGASWWKTVGAWLP